jgi:hypothetical protein
VPSEVRWLLLPILATWVLALCLPRVRNAYVNGWRCILRHSRLWKLPAAFTLAYGVFQLVDFTLLHWRMRQVPETSISLTRTFPDPVQVALASILPAFESLAGALNCLVATFPISVVCGLLFLTNYRGLTGELAYVLLRRFGRVGWLFVLALAFCALAAIVKPFALLALPELAQVLTLREFLVITTIINALSFAFEYLLGSCLQVYLVLVAYGWVRGLDFHRARVLHFAVRRMGFVLKWSLVIIIVTIGIIHLPLFVEAWFTGDPASWSTFAAVEEIARPALAAAMILLGTVQIRLALHNDSLRCAIYAHWDFLKRHGILCLAFLLAAFATLFVLQGLQHGGSAWLGTALWSRAWSIALEVINAMSMGWILAAWVCFYKRSEAGAPSVPF